MWFSARVFSIDFPIFLSYIVAFVLTHGNESTYNRLTKCIETEIKYLILEISF